MTDQAFPVSSDVDNARTVENARYALADSDFDMWDIAKATVRGLAA
jgi:hypothetical protein